MSKTNLGKADYPVAEKRPEMVRSATGKSLDELSLAGVVSGDVTIKDLRITPEALDIQADIANSTGRDALAANFKRAAEMASIPQHVVMEMYELLRPGRAKDKTTMNDAAQRLRTDYGANQLASFIEEAAEIYKKRGLFKFRY